MRFPEELAEKTKQLFPEAAKLHEAIENRDMTLVMGCLNELITPVMNFTNDWFMIKMETSPAKDGKCDENLQMKKNSFLHHPVCHVHSL